VTDPDDREEGLAEPRREDDGPPRRAPIYNDLRDDYDDQMIRTPASIARERVFVPAIAFVVIGILGILGTLVGMAAAVVEYFDSRQRDDDVVLLLFLLWVVCVGLCLFTLVIAGGLCMMRLRRYGLALTAAFVITGLALAGAYAILFFPFGIWGLVLLFRPDIRQEFGRRPPARVDD
jgi:hypothetical protein